MTDRRVLGLLVPVLLLPLLSGRARPESSWALVGTWTNSSYVYPRDMAPVVEYGADGTVEAYAAQGDAAPLATGPHSIERAWVEPGVH
jgi:hypothetical protein